jgi:hypothetical protein
MKSFFYCYRRCGSKQVWFHGFVGCVTEVMVYPINYCPVGVIGYRERVIEMVPTFRLVIPTS